MGNNSSKLTWRDYLRSMGPGAIMTAAIIGPGAVTTTSTQGASYGYTCLWLLLLSCIIAYFWQEPAIRMAIGLETDAMTGIRVHIGQGASTFMYIVIFVGSIAFQAGNLTGAAMALTYFFPGTSNVAWALTMSLAGFAIGWFNRYTLIEYINQLLILMMVAAFVGTAMFSGPSIGTLVTEGFTFRIPGGNAVLALSLLATTASPSLILGYSCFLRKKYPQRVANVEKQIKASSFDLAFNMFILFVITGSIVVCAGTLLHPKGVTITSAADMAVQLSPILGRFAGVFFSLGLWAAGFSSVLYFISMHNMLVPRAFNLSEDPKAIHNLFVTALIVFVPVVLIAMFGASPVSLIIAAQALNGVALPFVFGLAWILCTRKSFMGQYVNKPWQNVVMAFVTILAVVFAFNVIINNVIMRIIGML